MQSVITRSAFCYWIYLVVRSVEPLHDEYNTLFYGYAVVS